jgi:hypothetical protein
MLIGWYEADWANILPDITWAYNSLPTTAAGILPFQILYGVVPRLLPTTRTDLPLLDQCFDIQQDVTDALQLAQARMAIIFDSKHQPPLFEGSVYVNLYATPAPLAIDFPVHSNCPLSLRDRLKFFARYLTYPTTLTSHRGIHPVISVIHLKQAHTGPYYRRNPTPQPVIVDGTEQYKIEKI